MKQEKDRLQAKEILELIGGKENIISLSHCFTRLRFVLKDYDVVRTEEIKQLKDVCGVLKRTGSYQIVIGLAVTDYAKALKRLCADENNSESFM